MAYMQEIARSAEVLRAIAPVADDRAQRRLEEVHALLRDDMAVVEQKLALLAREGLSPATDSAAHLLAAGGKRVRPLTVMLSAACFGTPPPQTRDIAAVAELIHLATLLHDDVLDDGQERRGQPTSRKIWGNAVSILAGDLLLTHALARTADAAPHGVLLDLIATLRQLVDGEVVQLRGRKELNVHEDVYFRIVHDKTASLFAWAARSGAACAGAPAEAARALGVFGAHVGVAFQLVDDVLDYAGEPSATGKTLFVDLIEGKSTLPLIRALASESVSLREVEAVRLGDREAALRVAQAVVASGVCEGVRTLAHEETNRALAALASLPSSPAREMLCTIARELTTRSA
jgi:octaprenyl-diphosphate synthase